MILSKESKIRVVSALAEASSIRSIERMTGIHRDTVMRLGTHTGEACARLLDTRMRNITSKRIQVDELWGFVKKKEHRLSERDNRYRMGDQFTFVAIDADTKLVVAYMVGKRTVQTAYYFIKDLSERLTGRVQLTSDGWSGYVRPIEDMFGALADYAQLVKLYGQSTSSSDDRDWYKPVQVLAAVPTPMNGRPDPRYISTSYVERQNLTMRTHIKRLTRLTCAFSKKLRNLKAAIALHFAYYNFVKIHGTLRTTPALAAGLTERLWTLEEMLGAVGII